MTVQELSPACWHGTESVTSLLSSKQSSWLSPLLLNPSLSSSQSESSQVDECESAQTELQRSKSSYRAVLPQARLRADAMSWRASCSR